MVEVEEHLAEKAPVAHPAGVEVVYTTWIRGASAARRYAAQATPGTRRAGATARVGWRTIAVTIASPPAAREGERRDGPRW